jgi:hypothetical protein
MRSGRRLGDGSCPKWPPGWPGTTRFGGNDGIWTPFWEAVSLKFRFFRHRFLHQISEGVFRGCSWILDLIFMTFGLRNRRRNQKGEHMKNLCFHYEKPMFSKAQGSLFWFKNNEKWSRNPRRNRRRHFCGFHGFQAPFRAPKSRKNDKKTM